MRINAKMPRAVDVLAVVRIPNIINITFVDRMLENWTLNVYNM